MAGLEERTSSLEAEVGLLRENLSLQGRGDHQPNPHISLEALLANLAAIESALSSLLNASILTPASLYRLDIVRLRLAMLTQTLRVLKMERDLVLTQLPDPVLSKYVSSVVSRQPRMQPFKRRISKKNEKMSKKEKAQFIYEVTCIQGAVTSFAPVANSVAVSLVLQEDTRGKGLRGSTVPIEVLSVKWNGLVATIAVLFPEGTQVIPAAVTISLQGNLTMPDGSVTLVTLPQAHHAEPIVVCTNENQWEHAEGRLLRRVLFGPDVSDKDNITVSWTRFSNVLSELLIRATRQDVLELWSMPEHLLAVFPEPRRSLSSEDFEHLHTTRFNGSPFISVAQFASFWEWYGALCHQYRHNLTARTLFLSGVIYGLVSKAKCATLLPDDGMFLVRNSERSKHGEYSLAFRHNGEVKHHKIDQKKLRAPYGNLADYVRDKEELTMLVKPFHEKNGTVISAKVAVQKTMALAEFYSATADDVARQDGEDVDEEDEMVLDDDDDYY